MTAARVNDLPSPTGSQSVARWVRETPHAVAVFEDGRQYTYADLAHAILRSTLFLRRAGVVAGAIVGIERRRRYQHLVLILACECLGATTVSLSQGTLTAGNELLARCSWLCSETAADPTALAPRVLHLTDDVLATIGAMPVTEQDFQLLEFHPSLEGGGRIHRTSGTTGKPKTMHTSALCMSRIVEASRVIADLLGTGYHFLSIYAFIYRPVYMETLLALRFGCATCFTTLTSFHRDRVMLGHCHTILLPLEAASLSAGSPAGGDLRCGVHVDGGHLGQRLRTTLTRTFASSICNSYSMNETNYLALVGENGAGNLFPDTQIRITDDDGREKPTGETGKIRVCTPRMVSGYLWDDALTEKHFVDGWHITNDLGYELPNGQLVVVGRADDVLNIGGIKVPPQPIEESIKTIVGVSDAVLVGIENQQGLLDLHVVIERADPAHDSSLEARIRPLVNGCGRQFVAHFRSSLPRTQTGKVQRAELKALIA